MMMFRRRFHERFDCFKERIRSLILYVLRNGIVFFALSYILINLVVLTTLRNNLEHLVIGCSLIAAFLLILITYWRKKEKEVSETTARRNGGEGNEHSLSTKRKIFSILLLTVILPGLRLSVFISSEQTSLLEMRSFTEVFKCFQVEIVDEPSVGSKVTTYYGMILSDLLVEEELEPFKILFRYSNYMEFGVGDVCKICGTISEPENFDDFDYKKFLRNKNVYGILNVSSIEKVDKNTSIKSNLYDFKKYIVERVEKVMVEPQISLLVGILFGENRNFSEEFEENLRKSGTSHIVAASGYNVTILVIVINKLFKFINKKWRNLLSLLVIWGFCIMSGGSSSIIRATIMGSLVLVANSFGRYQSIHKTLLIGIWLFAFFSPTVIFDVGFQLSICATLGLIYFAPALENFLKSKFKIGNFFKEYLLTTISCTLCTLPVSIYTFGTFSIVSVLANSLILPVLESTMLWGFLGLLLNFVLVGISKIFLTVCFVQLKYFEIVVSKLGGLEFISFSIEGNLKIAIAIAISLLLLIFVIIKYPIENESFNYYFRLTRREDD